MIDYELLAEVLKCANRYKRVGNKLHNVTNSKTARSPLTISIRDYEIFSLAVWVHVEFHWHCLFKDDVNTMKYEIIANISNYFELNLSVICK